MERRWEKVKEQDEATDTGREGRPQIVPPGLISKYSFSESFHGFFRRTVFHKNTHQRLFSEKYSNH